MTRFWQGYWSASKWFGIIWIGIGPVGMIVFCPIWFLVNPIDALSIFITPPLTIIFPVALIVVGIFIGIHKMLKIPISWSIPKKAWHILTTAIGILCLPLLPVCIAVFAYSILLEFKPLLPRIAPLFAWLTVDNSSWDTKDIAFLAIAIVVVVLICELIHSVKRLNHLN